MSALGIYHPFIWNSKKSDIDSQTVFLVRTLDVILTGQFSTINLVNAVTGAVTSPTVTSYTWDVDGQTLNASRVTATLSNGVYYYLDVDGIYYSDLILRDVCNLVIETNNFCSNQYYDWDSDSITQKIYLPDPVTLANALETETQTLVTQNGIINKTNRIDNRYRLQFVAPVNYRQLLNSLKINDYVELEGIEIINIEVEEAEQEGGRYSLFTFSYQIKSELQNGSTCCEVINLDDLVTPENGGGSEDCEGFTATIDYVDGELTVTLDMEPVGTPSYRWYRNGIFISAATSINTTQSGDYKVEVKIGICTAISNYYIDNPCLSFQLNLSKIGSQINGTTSNVPDGETVDYSIVLNGVEVATSLPYDATTEGIYYVYATAGECQQVKGIFIELVEEDCAFLASITQDGSTLEVFTDAISPTYLWELETSAGRSTIGTGATVQIQGTGIYWLTVTNGLCTKEDYLYLEPSTGRIIVLNRSNGSEFTVTDISLLNIQDPAIKVTVHINGTLQSYVSGTPSAPNQWGIKSDGKLLVFGTLTNATIKIVYNP
jgi:hypothetical protein